MSLHIFGHPSALHAPLITACGSIDIRLRWGGPQVPEAINGSVHLLNGLEQLQALHAAGVACPEFTTDKTVALNWCKQIYSVFARTLNHTQGKDIVAPYEDGFYSAKHHKVFGSKFTKIKERWNNADFWTKYIRQGSDTHEWRMHVIKFARGYRTIARSLKVYEGSLPLSAYLPVVRSRRLGWTMDHTVEPPKGLRTIAKKACEACAYELGAVDILETGDAQQPFVALEINSRPAIRDPYTVAAYAKAFQALASERN